MDLRLTKSLSKLANLRHAEARNSARNLQFCRYSVGGCSIASLRVGLGWSAALIGCAASLTTTAVLARDSNCRAFGSGKVNHGSVAELVGV